jgi:hypothetical protein
MISEAMVIKELRSLAEYVTMLATTIEEEKKGEEEALATRRPGEGVAVRLGVPEGEDTWKFIFSKWENLYLGVFSRVFSTEEKIKT